MAKEQIVQGETSRRMWFAVVCACKLWEVVWPIVLDVRRKGAQTIVHGAIKPFALGMVTGLT